MCGGVSVLVVPSALHLSSEEASPRAIHQPLGNVFLRSILFFRFFNSILAKPWLLPGSACTMGSLWRVSRVPVASFRIPRSEFSAHCNTHRDGDLEVLWCAASKLWDCFQGDQISGVSLQLVFTVACYRLPSNGYLGSLGTRLDTYRKQQDSERGFSE